MSREFAGQVLKHGATALPFFVIAIAICLLWPQPFEILNANIYDAKLFLRVPPEPSRKIVLLDLDDDAFRKYGGGGPWDRTVMADLTTRLKKLGARAIVFELLFNLGGATKEGDEAFARALAQAGNTVGVTQFGEVGPGPKTASVNDEARPRLEALFERAWKPTSAAGFDDVLVPTRIEFWSLSMRSVTRSCTVPAHAQELLDLDGVIRRVPVIVNVRDRIVPSMSLATLVMLKDADPKKGLYFSALGNLVVGGDGKTVTVPTAADGTMLINWTKPEKKFTRYPVSDVLGGELDLSKRPYYQDKIVIISTAWAGRADPGTNPFDLEPLSRFRAEALNTMLSGNFITQLPVWPHVIILAAAAALLVTIVCAHAGSWPGVGLSIVIAALYAFFIVFAFTILAMEVPASQFFFILLVAMLLCAVRFLIEQAGKRKKAGDASEIQQEQ